MQPDLTPSTVVVRVPDQVSTQVKGETVLLQLKSGKYYSLNRVGTVIWELLGTPTTIHQVVDGVVRDFEVDRAECEADVLSLIANLSDAGFVEIRS